MQISIVAFDGFNEIDTFTTMGILSQMRGDGWTTSLVCAAPKIISANSVTVASQRPLEWAIDSDVVLFSSGSRMREVAADEKLVRRMSLDPAKQLIGAQCNASLLLKNLRVLYGPEVCAEHASMAALIQAGLKPIAQPLLVHGNVATAGGRLAATYLAAWVIWRLDSIMAVQHALTKVAPAGEEAAFVAHVLAVVQPFIEGAQPVASAETVAQAAPLVLVETAPEPYYDEEDEVEDEPLLPEPEPVPVAPARPDGPPLFGGAVETTGRILAVQKQDGDTLRVKVSSGSLPISRMGQGDRVAVNGQSQLIVAKSSSDFQFDVAVAAAGIGLEQEGAQVNLERELVMGQRVSRHLLQGQVDGFGEVLKFAQAGENSQLVVQVDGLLAPFIAVHGHIGVNGVALMVTQVRDVGNQCIFSVLLNAQVMQATALSGLRAGARVNVETDMVARNVRHMLPDKLGVRRR